MTPAPLAMPLELPMRPDWLLHLARARRPQRGPAGGQRPWATCPCCSAAGSGLGDAWAAAGALPHYRVVELRRPLPGSWAAI
jgi:hypothetical protein